MATAVSEGVVVVDVVVWAQDLAWQPPARQTALQFHSAVVEMVCSARRRFNKALSITRLANA